MTPVNPKTVKPKFHPPKRDQPKLDPPKLDRSSIKIRNLITPPHETLGLQLRSNLAGITALSSIAGVVAARVMTAGVVAIGVVAAGLLIARSQVIAPIKPLIIPLSALSSASSAPTHAITPLDRASPAVAVSQTSPFGDAIRSATQAADRTQVAETRADWQQVATLWQTAIDLLEQVPATDEKYLLAQQKISQYQRNFIYVQLRLQQIPDAGELGVTLQSLRAVFEQPTIGFQFKNATPIEGQPRIMGQSSNQLALLELIGAPAHLTKITLIVGLPQDDANARVLNRIYLLRLLQQLFPEWNTASDWLTQSMAQLSDGYSGDVITIRDHKRIKLSAIGAIGTVVLVIEPN